MLPTLHVLGSDSRVLSADGQLVHTVEPYSLNRAAAEHTKHGSICWTGQQLSTGRMAEACCATTVSCKQGYTEQYD
jgi:hypothetical protein